MNHTESHGLQLCAELDQADAKNASLEARLEDQARMGMLVAVFATVFGYALGLITMAVLWW